MIISIGLIATVSATDFNESGYISNNSEIIETIEIDEYSENIDILGSIDDSESMGSNYYPTDFDDLKSKVSSANDGDTIYLSGHYSFLSEININKKLNFIGTNNAILDGQNNTRLFTVNANDVVFKDIIFKNGKVNIDRDNAGAVFVKGNTTFDNCNFINNQALWAGAIYADAECLIKNCHFENNFATIGGAVVFNDKKSTVYDSTFKFNTAVISGGSLVYGNANNCTFISNHVAGDGGAISGCDLIYKCKFINNTVDGSGGAIFSSSAAVDCTFIGNNAQLTGGAIRFTSGHEAKVVNCYFENNYAQNGGVLYLSGNQSIISNSNFFNNYATDSGGVIYHNASRPNNVYKEGEKNIIISNCDFENNHAANYGGVIEFFQSFDLEFNDCNFSNCYCENNSGGAISVKKVSNLNIEGCSFDSCYSNEFSGAIHFEGVSNAYIGSSKFNNCSSEASGVISIHSINLEGIYYSSSNITISKSNFTDNHAVDDACIGTGGSNALKINGCNFENNVALSGASCIESNNCKNIEISDSIFKNCKAIGQRAALKLYTTDGITIDKCEFDNCTSNKTGGVLALIGSSNVIINNSDFTNNHCNEDAGVMMIAVSDINISNSKFINNSASRSFGAIYAKNDEGYGSSINIDNSIFERCSDSNNYGAIGMESLITYDIHDNEFDVAPKGITYYNNSIFEAEDVSIVKGEEIDLNIRLRNSNNPLAYKYVSFSLNGKSTSSPTLSDGTVKFRISNFVSLVGKYTATITFDGDGVNRAVSKNVSVTVNDFRGVLSASQVGNYYGDTVLKFKVTDSDNQPVRGVNIELSFSDGTKVDLNKTDKEGLVSYNVLFSPGSYDFTARVTDDYVDVKSINGTVDVNSINGKIEITQNGRFFEFKTYNPDNGDIYKNIKLNIHFSGFDPVSSKTNDEGIYLYNFPGEKGNYDYLLVTVNEKEYMKFTPSELRNIVINTEYDSSIVSPIDSKIIFGDSIIFDYLKSGSTTLIIIGGDIGSLTVLGHPEAKWSYQNNILTVSNLAVGTYTLRVVSNPYDNYYANEASLKITVNKVSAVVKASKITVVLKKGTLWTVKITDYKTGKPISGLKLNLKIYTGSKFKTVSVTTNSKGEASYKTNGLSKGNHKVVVSANHNGYNLNPFTSSINVIKQTSLKFKLKEKHDDNGGSLRSFIVTNKKTKKGVNGVKIKVFIYTGKKVKSFTLKTKKIKGKKGTYNGAVGFATNQFSAGKHKVVLKPVSIKYKGSITTSIKIKKKATKGPKFFRTI